MTRERLGTTVLEHKMSCLAKVKWSVDIKFLSKIFAKVEPFCAIGVLYLCHLNKVLEYHRLQLISN